MTGRVRVAVVSPEPTPYRAPLFDRIADDPRVELTVFYAGTGIQGHDWTLALAHPHVLLRGWDVPFAERLFHHRYPVDPSIVRRLSAGRFDCVVVAGWSTFAAQAAILWSRVRRKPYIVLSESHELEPRSRWRRALKRVVVPRLLRPAEGILVTGSLAGEHAISYGAEAGRVRTFANTVDVEAFAERASELASRRQELREGLGADPQDIVVLSVARLVAAKGLDTLVEAVALAGDSRLLVAIAGEGTERRALERLAAQRGVRLRLLGAVPPARMVEAYAAADVFALLSRREPWGVAVVEASACALPLLLSDRVGAARDLLQAGVNGELVAADDAGAAALALLRLLEEGARLEQGRRSRERAASWGYQPSVEAFVAAVREAVDPPSVLPRDVVDAADG